jgi:hypothetical protein
LFPTEHVNAYLLGLFLICDQFEDLCQLRAIIHGRGSHSVAHVAENIVGDSGGGGLVVDLARQILLSMPFPQTFLHVGDRLTLMRLIDQSNMIKNLKRCIVRSWNE